MYHKRKGGISASLSAEAYKAEASNARAALLERFPEQPLGACLELAGMAEVGSG